MRVDGTDPLAVGRIQDQTSRSEVQRLTEVTPDIQIRRREEAIRGQEVPQRSKGENYSEKLEEAVREANRATEAANINLRFQVHEESERVMMLVFDMEKNEVIKEIPPEDLLNLIGQIQEMIGLLLDERR